jgi:phosphatidylglycerol---prolipoprotein diacylglyceryl transferase
MLDPNQLLLAFQFQSPGPIFLRFGFLTVRWYGLLIATGVLAGLFLAQQLAKRRQINPDLLSDLAIWLVIGAIPCARLYYVLFEWQRYSQEPSKIVAIWEGGIAIHGAIIGGILAGLLFARKHKISFWQLVDLVAPALILGQAIGRWGNFFNSEAFGAPTNLPWRLFIAPEYRPPAYKQFDYFHPTFLYESLWNLAVLALLLYLFFWGLRHRDRFKVGTLGFVYLAAYNSGRIWIEGLRTDSLMLGYLKVAQVIGLGSIALGLFGLFWLYYLQRPLPDTVKTLPNQTTGFDREG